MTLEPLYLIQPTGAIVELDAGVSMREVIGGWIERVVLIPADSLGDARTYGLDMWADEEGLLRALPLNPVATVLASTFGHAGPIVGPVVVAGSMPPEITGCPEGVGVEIRRIAEYVTGAGNE